jgi:hypothetical protein
MAISPDQRATLQLLLEREQSYADLARLLAVDEAEVRARARAALTELGGADPDRNVGLTDYLLGQADPIGRADASRHLRDDPEDHALATALSERLGDMFPAAELPRLPGEPRRPRRRRPAAAAEREAPARGPARLSASQTRVLVVVASAAVLVVAAVLAITGTFRGDDEDGSSTASAEETPAAPTAGDEEIQRVTLRPTAGGDASGDALFGLATGDQPFVEVAIDGLDPAPADQQYVVWLMLTQTEGYPLSPINVSQQGSYSNRFPLPSAVLPVVARVRFVDVSIAPAKQIRQVVRAALEESSLVLEKPGRTVLRGTIPRADGQSPQ